MKKCGYCGAEYSDDESFCAIDRQRLDGAQTQPEISAGSNSFSWAELGMGIRVALRLVIVFLAYVLVMLLPGYLKPDMSAWPAYLKSLFVLYLYFVLPFAGYCWVLRQTTIFRRAEGARYLALMGLSVLLAVFSFIGAAMFFFSVFGVGHAYVTG